MTIVRDRLESIKTKIIMSGVVQSMTIVSERAMLDRGYFRARLHLINGDFVEVSEYFILRSGNCSTVEYRHQWMDKSKTKLIKRWDNAEHFPDLANYPHHVHLENDEKVIPGTIVGIIELINVLEKEIDHDAGSGAM